MTELTGMMPQELSDWCKAQGMPAFRGKQIFRWIHQGADFDAMTNLPAAMRAQLKEIAVAQPVSIIDERKSQIDDTVKFLFGLKDGNCVEGVLMHYHHGYTLCISTQVGCRMGCKFCASTLEGCVRSLTAGEMLGEVLAANRYLDGKDRVHNIVLMGSGEPLDNYDNVCRFLRLLREEDGAPFVLEINTIPGMPPSSLLPKAAAASGWPYEDLCEKIAELSLATPRK